MNKICVYAIKDIETNLFFNRVHKDLKPLSQNTAFYKTLYNAEKEMEFTIERILSERYKKYCEQEFVSFKYHERDRYIKTHKDNIKLKVVKIEIGEIDE